MYDPQIGRFHQVDPLADITDDWSPYSFAFNNPVSFNDPFGLTSDTSVPGVPLMPEVIVTESGSSALTPVCMTCGSTPDPSKASAANPLPTGSPTMTVVPRPGPPGKIIPFNKPELVIPRPIPILAPAALTVIGVLIPLDAGPRMPFGDEMYYRRPLFDPFASPETPGNQKDYNSITLYRGVHAGHPDIANARVGMAVPMGFLNGHDDPRRHNGGDINSVFTSWTINKGIAAMMAGRRGWGGIILTKRFHKSQITLSPDKFFQLEVLIRGIVSGATPENARSTK
jgi:hypothetical protein